MFLPEENLETTNKTSALLFEIERDAFLYALSAVNAASGDSDMGWIEMSFQTPGQVVFSSMGFTLSVKYTIKLDFEGSGSIKVSGKQLSEYVKQLPSSKIKVKMETPSEMVLRCGRSSARIQLIHDESTVAHEMPTCSKGSKIFIKGKELDAWISAFKDFVCVDDTRFYANGALIWLENGFHENKLFAVASDSLRLAKAELKSDFTVEKNEGGNVLVPKKCLEEVRRFAQGHPETVFELKWDEEDLVFGIESESLLLYSKCVSGKYPDYEAAIPKNPQCSVVMDPKAFLESVRRVNLFSDKNKVIKLSIKESLVTLTSFIPGQKSGEEVLEILEPIGSEIVANYNGSLLMAILSALSGQKVTISWESVNRPMKIIGDDNKLVEVFYLLVPARY